jgi:hypothetical protein
MANYIPNRRCYCNRCRCRGFIGPVILITLGVLFLLSEFEIWRFHNSWPILLIAIGVAKVLASTADFEGHVPPSLPEVFRSGFAPSSYPPPQTPPPPGDSAPGTPPSAQGVDHV